MSFSDRRDFYESAMVDGNLELDYLSSKLPKMSLSTVEYHTVDIVTQYRPDLISLKYYGNYHFGWLIAEHNEFLDPIMDFYSPRVVKIPSLTEYYQFYNRNSRKV